MNTTVLEPEGDASVIFEKAWFQINARDTVLMKTITFYSDVFDRDFKVDKCHNMYKHPYSSSS